MILRVQAILQRINAKKVSIYTYTKTSDVLISITVAMKTLANSEYHFSKATETNIPDKVDLFTFMKVCDEVLGIKAR